MLTTPGRAARIASCFAPFLLLLAAGTQAAERCLPLLADTTSVRVTKNCSSPVGVCTAGSVSGLWLNGEQRYTASILLPAPGSGGSQSLIYAGTIEITTAQGGFTIADIGVFDPGTGAIAEVGSVSGGTDVYKGASGRTYLIGQSNSSGGFDGRLTGTICIDR